LNPDLHVKPEMTASVTFQEKRADAPASGADAGAAAAAPVILVPKRAVAEQRGQSIVWVVTSGTVARRPVTLGAERIEQVEGRGARGAERTDEVEGGSGVVRGEMVIRNPPQGLSDGGVVRVKGS